MIVLGLAKKQVLRTCEPVLNYMETVKHPVSIKEVSEQLKIKYNTAKHRLHKLIGLGLIKRFRPGIYALHEFTVPKLKAPLGKAIIIRGAISTVGSSGDSYRLLIYNCRIAQAIKGLYVQVKRQKALFIVHRASRYVGRKVSVYKCGSASVQVSKSTLSAKEKELMKSGRTVGVHARIYPAEFSLSFSEVFGTEAREDGILAEALINRGVDVKKFGRRDDIKGDLEVVLPACNAMVEITKALPGNKTDRGNIKSCELLGRFYYALKWVKLHDTPAFLVIRDIWKKGGWIKRERDYLRKMNVYLLFTNFGDNWGERSADEILRTMRELLTKPHGWV